MRKPFDITIIGAGIIGLATAFKLSQLYPHLRLAVVEKEDRPAAHQTGHNSGVIHSGLYYRPGSLKARMCISGAMELIRHCEQNDIPYEICGKLVIAARQDEIPRLHELFLRGKANGIAGMRLLDPSQAIEFEPYVKCLQALHVPATGIVDFGQVAMSFASFVQSRGNSLLLNHEVQDIQRTAREIYLETNHSAVSTRFLLNCGGLYSDRIALMAGVEPHCRIVPFRGEYYTIKPERKHLVRNLIYPVPDPRFPFLGVHFTRRVDGKVEAGPNAVLAWAREGYYKRKVNWAELKETLLYRGFWLLVLRYWKPGIQEMVRSFSRGLFAKALQQLVPDVREDDLLQGGAGVRAQALGSNGTLLDDFVIQMEEKMIHVLNAPSPAATSALAIADHIARLATTYLKI